MGVFEHSGKLTVAAAAALLAVASCAGAAGAQQECSWGASSITASYENGRMIVSEPRRRAAHPPTRLVNRATDLMPLMRLNDQPHPVTAPGSTPPRDPAPHHGLWASDLLRKCIEIGCPSTDAAFDMDLTIPASNLRQFH